MEDKETEFLCKLTANHLFLAQFEPLRATLRSLRVRSPELARSILQTIVAKGGRFDSVLWSHHSCPSPSLLAFLSTLELLQFNEPVLGLWSFDENSLKLRAEFLLYVQIVSYRVVESVKKHVELNGIQGNEGGFRNFNIPVEFLAKEDGFRILDEENGKCLWVLDRISNVGLSRLRPDMMVVEGEEETEGVAESVEEIGEEEMMVLKRVILENAEVFDVLCVNIEKQLGMIQKDDSGMAITLRTEGKRMEVEDRVFRLAQRCVQIVHLDAMKELLDKNELDGVVSHLKYLHLDFGVEDMDYRLRVLNLSNNALSGKIPANLSYCSEMVTVGLKRNKLEGKIPIDQLSNLKKLERLTLFSNNLTGEIPSSIRNLSSLIKLTLDFNNLEGNLPTEMGLLEKLAMLTVAANNLSGIIPASIFNNSSILLISAGDNSFHGNLPTNIGLTLPNLEALGVGRNNFYGNFPTSITNASGLEVLDLDQNMFAGQVPTNLGDLRQLNTLFLEDNLFGSKSRGDLDFIGSLTNCSNLRFAELSGNKFGGNLPKIMANLSNQLTRLYLGGNQLSGTIPEGFGNFVNLIQLGLEENYLSGIIPSDFDKLPNLQFLTLYQNDLSGQIVSTLGNNTNLFYLDLSTNQFEGGNIFDNVLMSCQNLQYLDISHNNFTGIISPHFLETHSSLIYMELSESSLTGSLPPEVGKLIHLVDFNVSHNQFAGDIPISLADCSNLANLSMQANFFQGTIPPNLASWKSIQQLDLSSNNLTGPIPRELEKLQFLSNLNLSYNDIEGEIPNTGIFSNASQISLTGNNKLCGGIPELEFPPCPVIKGKNRGKLKVVILLSIVLPATLLVLGALLLYSLVHRKRERRIVAGFSSMPTRVKKLLRISYHELHRATSGFSPENLIGSGNFGAVYKGRLEKYGNKLVAVKVLDLQKNGASKSFKAECKALRNIRHRNLVSIVSYCSSIDSKRDEFQALVYEFMENGNLDLWLHPAETTDQATSSRSLNLSQKLNIAIDVASALQYLQNHCEAEIVHCDLKPSNILLDNDLVAHVSDFGLARLLPKPVNTSSEQRTSSTIAIKGSIGYAAPEYGMGLAASTQGDVYSYGILLLEMITGRRPTDDIFVGDLDLHNYVDGALHERVPEIVDPLLFLEGDENRNMTPGGKNSNGGKEMECIISLLKIGLKCSARLPNDRMHMNEVVRKLHLIKDVFLGVRVHQENIEA